MQPHEFSVIVVDSLPKEFLGANFSERFGIRPVFYKNENTNSPFFQASIFLQILDHSTNKVLFEFRTASDFKMTKKIDEIGFYELIYSFILTAIQGFDWHLKRKESDFTFDKSYSPLPKFEETKEAIRKAHNLAQFDKPSSN